MPKYRRTEYDEHWHPIIGALLGERGATDEQVARVLGIAHGTLDNWRRQHPEFAEALRTGKAITDAAVEGSLLERALGYDIEEITTERVKTNDGTILAETKRVRKSIPADATSMIFWLKNRQPQRWRDRRELDVAAIVTDVEPDFSDFTDDELRQAAELARKAGKVHEGNGTGAVH